MITVDGKYHIRRFLAGQVTPLAKAISFGVGSASPTTADKRLQFEIGRSPVDNVFYDYSLDKLIFKARVPEALTGVISEIGLWSEVSNAFAGASSERIIATFEDDGTWSGSPAWSTTNTRIGDSSLRQAPGAGATISNELLASSASDLSVFSAEDKFVFAYYNLNTNTSTVTFRFKTDASNYYSYTATNPVAGYHFDEVLKSGCVVTGTPTWARIETVEVITVSKAGVSSSVDFDGITIADVDTVNPAYVLIARQLQTPFTVLPGVVNEIELPLGITL